MAEFFLALLACSSVASALALWLLAAAVWLSDRERGGAGTELCGSELLGTIRSLDAEVSRLGEQVGRLADGYGD